MTERETEREATSRRYFPEGRIAAYTDGVFAIAATLLVLDLTVRTIGEVGSDGELWNALLRLGDPLLAFVISFLLLSMMWFIHLQQFRDIERVDTVLLWINNVRLLFIVLVPFTTSLIAEYNEFMIGRVLLPVNFFIVTVLGTASWWWAASRGGHLLRAEARPTAWKDSMAGVSAVSCAAVAVAVSPWLGSIGFLAYAFDGLLTKVLQRWAERRRG